jgi:glutamate synthase domain-containing protein 3
VGELTGRVDLLERRGADELAAAHGGDPALASRQARIDLSEILARPEVGAAGARHADERPRNSTSALNETLCQQASAGALAPHPIRNTDRAVGATLAGQLALGVVRPPAGGFRLQLNGYAGQGLGFACVDGLDIELSGYANDGVGEAMTGGVIAIRVPEPVPPEARFTMSTCGNAACYGATGGALFVEGRAGQRIGVRNSGATIVVEGAGKYAFEYMTGGVGVVLGPIGPVVASGMTGGTLYLHGDREELAAKLHGGVRALTLSAADEKQLHALVALHRDRTGSRRAAELLAEWGRARAGFVKVVPT